jgi:tetratricopeptide (TPR) repeat protein
MKMKIALICLIVFMFFPLAINPAFSESESSSHDKEIAELEKKILEFGKEFEKNLIEILTQMLEGQIQRMEKNQLKANKENKALIEKFNLDIEQNPDNPKTHFYLGEAYDSIGDGANAILHTMKANELYLQQKDRAGVAQCRRALRHYHEKYDFKPEDFQLSPKNEGSRV